MAISVATRRMGVIITVVLLVLVLLTLLYLLADMVGMELPTQLYLTLEIIMGVGIVGVLYASFLVEPKKGKVWKGGMFED